MIERHAALTYPVRAEGGRSSTGSRAARRRDRGVHDIAAFPGIDAEAQLNRAIEAFFEERVDVTCDPLLAARVLRLGAQEHVLLIGMEHLISDAFSLNLLQRDWWRHYALRGAGVGRDPLDVAPSFADYARDQAANEKDWLRVHESYWRERFHQARRLVFAGRSCTYESPPRGREGVPIRIDSELKRALQSCARAQRTTLVLSVFTAFVAFVMRWCETSDAILRYQTDGRPVPEVREIMGFFAAILHVRVELTDQDRFTDLLARVTAEYCRAYEHADCGYLEAQESRPAYTANPAFNWVSQEPRGAGLASAADLFASSVPFTHPALKTHGRDVEPSVLLYDTDEEVVGGFHFPIHQFSRASQERVARNFMLFLQTLARQPESRVKDLTLMS